jgi:hypothetical protein
MIDAVAFSLQDAQIYISKFHLKAGSIGLVCGWHPDVSCV